VFLKNRETRKSCCGQGKVAAKLCGCFQKERTRYNDSPRHLEPQFTMSSSASRIEYSEKYADEANEYR
jgi:hypothetical protein